METTKTGNQITRFLDTIIVTVVFTIQVKRIQDIKEKQRMNDPVEKMEYEMRELTTRFWEEDINLSEEINKIRAKYSKETRRRFSFRNPPDPNLMRVFASIVSLPDEIFRVVTKRRGEDVEVKAIRDEPY